MPAQGDSATADAGYAFAPYSLTVSFAALPGFEQQAINHSQIKGDWRGALGATKVRITLSVLPRKEFGIDEPDDVGALIILNGKRWAKPGAAFTFDEKQFVSGPFGWAPYALVASAKVDPEVTAKGEANWLGFMCGVTEEFGYQLNVECFSDLDEAQHATLQTFLTSAVRYDGKVRNAEWTDEEARARWEEFTDPKLHKKLEIKRTKHYLILFNAGGNLFAKKMEEFYKEVQKVYPFEEVEGRRLMPVFLFRTKNQYVDYYAKIANTSKETAANSKGHAWRDYYATYYDSPNDPVHIHEATHQIFANRLGLSGGGSWFQEGVAEFMSERFSQIRSAARNMIKSGEYVPFGKFVTIPSLLNSAPGASKRGGSKASNNYAQAASIVAFVAKSKFGKKHFLKFVHAIGKVRRGDLKSIDRRLQEVFGVDLEGFEAEWKSFWR